MTLVSRDRWKALWHAVGASGDPAPWFDRLSAAYSEPQRHYHNLRHIAECQREFDAVRNLARSAEAVELAIWFHDAVYDTHAGDNEEKSAALAEQCFRAGGIEDSFVRKVKRLVLATKDHDVAVDEDAAILVDVDLSILGQPERRFVEYESQIRQEYAWVDDVLFTTKRREILRRFLSRRRIYATDWFYTKYETQARLNLERSIEQVDRPIAE